MTGVGVLGRAVGPAVDGPNGPFEHQWAPVDAAIRLARCIPRVGR